MTYLGESLLAIHEDGVPLAGTFSWCGFPLLALFWFPISDDYLGYGMM